MRSRNEASACAPLDSLGHFPAALAAAESDPLRKDLFLQLAQAESSHAQLWRDKLSSAGIQDERFAPGFRTRLLAKLAQRFGPRFVLPTIAATEFADRNKYAGQSDAHAICAEERGHAGAHSIRWLARSWASILPN
jgi:vacuolar iron transporter family protein